MRMRYCADFVIFTPNTELDILSFYFEIGSVQILAGMKSLIILVGHDESLCSCENLHVIAKEDGHQKFVREKEKPQIGSRSINITLVVPLQCIYNGMY